MQKNIRVTVNSGNLLIPWSESAPAKFVKIELPREFSGFVKLHSMIGANFRYPCLVTVPQIDGARVNIDPVSLAEAIMRGQVRDGGIDGSWRFVQYAGALRLRLLDPKPDQATRTHDLTSDH